MIYVVKEKHLNDFQQVHCVRPKDLYSRLGHRTPNVDFDSSTEPIPMNQSKIDAMQSFLNDYDNYMQEQEAQRESAGADAKPQGDESPE